MNTFHQSSRYNRRLLTTMVVLFMAAIVFPWQGTDIAIAVDGLKKDERATEIHKALPKIWISAQTALRQVKSHPATILVDIRNPKDFGKVSIPGSLNIPLHFIKTKQRLKNAFLILVGESYGYHLALQTCLDLQKSGFNARVLFGGLQAWRASGGLVEGDLTVLSRYKYIPPRAFNIDLADGLVMPIRMGKKDTNGNIDMIPGLRYVSVGKKPEAIVKQLKKIAADIKQESGYKTPVIVDMAGRNIEDLEALSRKAGIENIRFLKGGLIAYHKYLSGLAQAGKPREDRLQTTGNCSPCAEKIGKQPAKE